MAKKNVEEKINLESIHHYVYEIAYLLQNVENRRVLWYNIIESAL